MLKMRRPLAAVCLFAVAVVYLLVSFGVLPSDRARPDAEDGSAVTVCGTAGRIYDKYIVLTDAVIQGSGMEQGGYTFIADFGEASGDVRLGETVTVMGRYREFAPAYNPGNFDALEHYTSKGFDGMIRDPVVLSSDERVNLFREALRRIREGLGKRLYEVCPEKEASILCDLLLGDRDGLDEETEKLYRNNGIAHILSISGLHISILGMGCYRLLRKAKCRNIPSALTASGVLVLYGMMTGMSTSAMRAVGMFVIAMLAHPARKTADPLTSLSVMAAFVALTDPRSIKGVSFLLSYGAALGIFVYLPASEHLFTLGRISEARYEEGRAGLLRKRAGKLRKAVLSAFRASFSMTVFTLPVQLFFFYRVSVFSVVLNVLILPLMSVLVFAGMITLIPGFGIAGKLCCLILGYFEMLCRAADSLPVGRFAPGRPGILWIIIYYAFITGEVLFSAYIKKHKRFRSLRTGLAAELLTACLPLLLIFPLPRANTSTQLYIGQGNCNVMITDAREVYMFDCGSTSLSAPGEYTVLPFLRYNGIGRIDAVFLSHSDLDHINGCLEMLEHMEEWELRIGAVYITPQMLKEGSDNSASLKEACLAAGVPLRTLSAGDSWQSGSTVFTCLHPDRGFAADDPNDGSMCILAEFERGISVLIPGDVQGEGEEALIRSIGDTLGGGRLDVYITAHHGSSGSTTEAFLAQARPRLAINSAGLNNRYSHPSPLTLDRLDRYGCVSLTTFETGAVFLDLGGEDLRIRTMLGP